jgi:juvenile hormone acid methyltransferase
MHNGKMYLRTNNFQRRDALEILGEFSNYFKWSYDGADTLMDIGCGTGDVLYDFILPKVPENYHKVIGVDISEEILKCAKENFGNKLIEFHQMDISSSACCKHFKNEEFDQITSFYALHWIQNQKYEHVIYSVCVRQQQHMCIKT